MEDYYAFLYNQPFTSIGSLLPGAESAHWEAPDAAQENVDLGQRQPQAETLWQIEKQYEDFTLLCLDLKTRKTIDFKAPVSIADIGRKGRT